MEDPQIFGTSGKGEKHFEDYYQETLSQDLPAGLPLKFTSQLPLAVLRPLLSPSNSPFDLLFDFATACLAG